VHNNELDVLVTKEGLKYYERLLRWAGKQFKSGKTGTEFQEKFKKLGLIHNWQS
jgi:hypothetical protein